MGRSGAPGVLAYSDGMIVGPPACVSFQYLVTDSDGRPQARPGQAESQKAGQLARLVASAQFDRSGSVHVPGSPAAPGFLAVSGSGNGPFARVLLAVVIPV